MQKRLPKMGRKLYTGNRTGGQQSRRHEDNIQSSKKAQWNDQKNRRHNTVNQLRKKDRANHGVRGGNNKTEKEQTTKNRKPGRSTHNWQEFLSHKFTTTELEKMRADFEALPKCNNEREQLTRDEFDQAVKLIKMAKHRGKMELQRKYRKIQRQRGTSSLSTYKRFGEKNECQKIWRYVLSSC